MDAGKSAAVNRPPRRANDMVCRTADTPRQTSKPSPTFQQPGVKGPIVRNPTVPETPLEPWPAKRKPGSIIVLPGHRGSAAHRRPLPSPRIDEQRLADLAHEILAAAIRLAAMLEVAQQISSEHEADKTEAAAMGEYGNA